MKKGQILQIGYTSGKPLRDCTHIKAIEIISNDAIVPENLDIGFAQEPKYLEGLTELYVQAGVRYWGYL